MFGRNLQGSKSSRRSAKSSSKSLLSRNISQLIPCSVSEKKKFEPKGYYDDDTDIQEIHQYVISVFEREKDDIPTLEKGISDMKKKLGTPLFLTDRNMLNESIQRDTEKIDLIRSQRRMNEYLERVAPILESWRRRLDESVNVALGKAKTFDPECLLLVRSFVQIAREYAPLNLTIKPFPDSSACPYCRKRFDDQEDVLVCFDCNVFQSSFSHDAEYADLSRINGSNNNNYVNRETFIRTLACYQGKQKMEYPPELKDAFDKWCRLNRVSVDGMTYDRARPIFKAIGYSGYFDDINLMLSTHPDANHQTPDVSEWENVIVRDYDRFTQKYAEIKGDARNSALNAWYLLYILMSRRQIPCRRCDLKMPDTKSIRISNDSIARQVFDSLGWTFTDTI